MTVQEREERKRYAVDIRVFLVAMAVSMAVAFMLGVATGPTGSVGSHTIDNRGAVHQLPEVNSVELNPELPISADDVGLHEPAGQHLLVDIKGIEADFLNSEERLVKAMTKTVEISGLTMLSYHCHSLVPTGVSCVGVLLESHISFHTWPAEGVITLDLFTCGSKPLIPSVQVMKDLFGIGDDIVLQWSHELRGFRPPSNNDDENPLATRIDHNSDLSRIVWSPIDCPVKEQIVSKVTKYQRVDIWDVVSLEETPSHEDAVRAKLQPDDPRWQSWELVNPDRMLFLNGVMQSDTHSNRDYHEAMVHPGMFSHPKPERVAIIGGGEGAPLREVLKHKTVESVTMIELDEELVQIVREHMPIMSDCSDLVGRAENCFDDPIANVVYEDAKGWFLDRYGDSPTKDAPAEPFEVVIMDALEPEISAPISKELYEDASFLSAVMKSLSSDGILALQIGRAPTVLDPNPSTGYNAPRERLFSTLESLPDVQAMMVYEEPRAGFTEPRAFMVVCKDTSCRSRFYANPDVMDYFIYDRIVLTRTNEKALSHFDGVTHLGYQVSPKAWETMYCRREPTPFECDYRFMDFNQKVFEFLPGQEDESAFEITADLDDDEEVEATHVHAKVHIPKGSYIMPDHLASSLVLHKETIDNLRNSLQYGNVTVIEDFVEYIEMYGHASKAEGSDNTLIEIGASYMIKVVDTEEEANVGRWIPPHPKGKRPKYSPVYERHQMSFDVFMVATKDIPPGTELLKYKGIWDEE